MVIIDLLRRRGVMIEDVNVSNLRVRWTGCGKGDLPLLSSLKAVMHSSCQRGAKPKSMGKKKSDGEKKAKTKDL
jgi:hypothetical protein